MFDVGGIIKITERIVVSKNIYIAGQTAPGGVSLYANYRCTLQLTCLRVLLSMEMAGLYLMPTILSCDTLPSEWEEEELRVKMP